MDHGDMSRLYTGSQDYGSGANTTSGTSGENTKKFLRRMVTKLRDLLRVVVIDATSFTTKTNRDNLRQAAKERATVTRALRAWMENASSVDRYNLEYRNARELESLTGVSCDFSGTHYWYWTPVMYRFELLGPVLAEHHKPMTLEVGAGNGDFLRTLQGWCMNMQSRVEGVDTSPFAVKRIEEKGFKGYQGRLQDVRLSADKYNMVFLSYFVDRDEDQARTFEECARIMRPNGTLVLEGLFPCVLTDSSGVEYGKANVTFGLEATADMQLVANKLHILGFELRRIVVGQRLVYSLDGSEVLPSYTLVLKKVE